MEYEFKIKKRDINTLLDTVKTNRPDADLDMILKAYKYAEDAHKEQKRLSGEPYIIHPLEVSIILAELHMDTHTIASALLHDVVEDTKIPLTDIESLFGKEVSYMVNGVTKISSMKRKTKSHEEAQTLRKMLLATISDSRVIIIKLADKIHNMRTIMFQPLHKQQRMARDVLNIYAPLASRLGISKISSELEDLAFHVLNLAEYNDIKQHLASQKKEMQEYIVTVSEIINAKIAELNLKAELSGRVKHIYSIHKKMITQNKSIRDIYDIRAIRIITEEVKDCYSILGIVHHLWSPVPARFKDYIAVPKSNGYQSLHTTVVGPGNHFLEVQIRTNEMDIKAEIGIAAHWSYKENSKDRLSNTIQAQLEKLIDIEKWRSDLKNTREFINELKKDLFQYQDEIYVFTPKGEIKMLPNDSSPIDFAFAIHSEVGMHCSGARVNNNMVPLKTKLKSGDMVEILTTASVHPSSGWLKIVKSSRAISKIKSYLKKQHQIKKEIELKKPKLDDDKVPEKTINIKIKQADVCKVQRKNSGICIEGLNVMSKLAQCCQPIPGDEVIGFITRGKGISIHKKNCPSIRRFTSEKERIVSISWTESVYYHPIKIVIKALDRSNLIKDVANIISDLNINISKMEAMRPIGGIAELKLVIEVKDIKELNNIILKVKGIQGVNDVYKLNEKVIR